MKASKIPVETKKRGIWLALKYAFSYTLEPPQRDRTYFSHFGTFLVFEFWARETSPIIRKTSFRESTDHVATPRYFVCLSTPSELGDTSAGSWGHEKFWISRQLFSIFKIPMNFLVFGRNIDDILAETRDNTMKIFKISNFCLQTSNACNFATTGS